MAKREPIDVQGSVATAKNALLSGLVHGDDVSDIMLAVARADLPHRFAPDVALIELAFTALDLACPAGADLLEYEGLRERICRRRVSKAAPITGTASTPCRAPPACPV